MSYGQRTVAGSSSSNILAILFVKYLNDGTGGKGKVNEEYA